MKMNKWIMLGLVMVLIGGLFASGTLTITEYQYVTIDRGYRFDYKSVGLTRMAYIVKYNATETYALTWSISDSNTLWHGTGKMGYSKLRSTADGLLNSGEITNEQHGWYIWMFENVIPQQNPVYGGVYGTITYLGNPIYNVEVQIVGGGIQPQTTYTDINGAYRFGTIIPGNYNIISTHPSDNHIYTITPVTILAGKTIKLDISLTDMGPVVAPDADSDSYIDNYDNCPNDYNPDQADSDGDGVGDVCDDPVPPPPPPSEEDEVGDGDGEEEVEAPIWAWGLMGAGGGLIAIGLISRRP